MAPIALRRAVGDLGTPTSHVSRMQLAKARRAGARERRQPLRQAALRVRPHDPAPAWSLQLPSPFQTNQSEEAMPDPDALPSHRPRVSPPRLAVLT